MLPVNFFGVDKRELLSSNRSNDIAFPRQIAMYLCYEIAHQSFPTIGREFGKRDHSTVMHAYRKIKNEIKDIPTTNSVVENIKRELLDE